MLYSLIRRDEFKDLHILCKSNDLSMLSEEKNKQKSLNPHDEFLIIVTI